MYRMCLISCLALILCSDALSEEIEFSWLPNSESNLAGYRIHEGDSPSTYNKVHDVGLPPTVAGRVKASITPEVGRKYYAATAYDTEGNESGYSDEETNSTLPSPILTTLKR